MTTAVAKATSVPFGAVTIYNTINAVEAFVVAVQTWNARRITRNALARLSDTQLNDIGLTFKDIRNFPLEAGKY